MDPNSGLLLMCSVQPYLLYRQRTARPGITPPAPKSSENCGDCSGHHSHLLQVRHFPQGLSTPSLSEILLQDSCYCIYGMDKYWLPFVLLFQHKHRHLLDHGAVIGDRQLRTRRNKKIIPFSSKSRTIYFRCRTRPRKPYHNHRRSLSPPAKTLIGRHADPVRPHRLFVKQQLGIRGPGRNLAALRSLTTPHWLMEEFHIYCMKFHSIL